MMRVPPEALRTTQGIGERVTLQKYYGQLYILTWDGMASRIYRLEHERWEKVKEVPQYRLMDFTVLNGEVLGITANGYSILETT